MATIILDIRKGDKTMNRKQKALKELYKVGTVFVYTEELYEELSKLYEIKHIKAGVCQIVAEK